MVAAGGKDVSSFGQALSTGAKAGFTVLPMNRARGSGCSTALKAELEDEEGSLRVGLAPCRLACRPYQQERWVQNDVVVPGELNISGLPET